MTHIILAASLFAASTNAFAAGACTAPAYRQFDFWAGDWDVFDVDSPTKLVARVHVDRILDGCVLREDYQAVDGKKGQSFSIYDASAKVWHQSWVTNRGEWLVIDGGLDGVKMILGNQQVRGVWTPAAGAVRETAVKSTDGGKTWKPWFDLWFRRHRCGAGTPACRAGTLASAHPPITAPRSPLTPHPAKHCSSQDFPPAPDQETHAPAHKSPAHSLPRSAPPLTPADR